VLSMLLALTATWVLHRGFTFRSADPRRFAEWLRFVGVNSVGAGINFGVYSVVLVALPGTPPLLALVMGSVMALIANYLGARSFAFRPRSTRAA
jgi:dolichol-phosphate mannosyltransferase